MTNRVFITPVIEQEYTCSFCGESEHIVDRLFIGNDGAMCSACLGFIREEMGFNEESELDKLVDGITE